MWKKIISTKYLAVSDVTSFFLYHIICFIKTGCFFHVICFFRTGCFFYHLHLWYFVAFFSLHSIRCFSHTIVTNVAYTYYNVVKKLTEEKLSQMSIRKNWWAKLDQKKKTDEHKQIGRKTWDEQNRDECLFDIRWADFQADGQLQLLCRTCCCCLADGVFSLERLKSSMLLGLYCFLSLRWKSSPDSAWKFCVDFSQSVSFVSAHVSKSFVYFSTD